MKIQFPFKVLISGRQWTVKCDRNLNGGWFDSKDTICIGLADRPRVFEILMHEVIEAVMVNQYVRYCLSPGRGNEGFMFAFNHREFEKVITEVASAMQSIFGKVTFPTEGKMKKLNRRRNRKK